MSVLRGLWKGAIGLMLAVMSASVAAQTVEYIHTDALGTPVAVTNSAGVVIERSEYEPYGALLNRPITDGPGFTGHVQDAATGLTYMQQRYYDPGIGRFLSVDPVTADGNAGDNFNRYKYAANNPYLFIDPDGRQETCTGSRVTCPSQTHGAPQNEPQARSSDRSSKNSASRQAASTSQSSSTRSTVEPLYCDGGADCDFMYNQREALEGNISMDEFMDRTVAQGKGGMTGAVLAVGFVGVAEGGAMVWGATAASVRYAWKNIRIDGPSPGLRYANGRVVGVSWRGSNLNVRLDYAPIPGSKGTPLLHINFGRSGRGQAPHIVIWDPRWYNPNMLK